MFKEYVSTYSKFEHIGRSLYYNFWSLFFDDRERARSGLSAAQIELGTANFSLLISTAKKIGNRFSQYREACYALIPPVWDIRSISLVQNFNCVTPPTLPYAGHVPYQIP